MGKKTIVLVGAGHSNLEIIRGLSFKLIKNNRFLLISPAGFTIYSGLIPGFIAGNTPQQDLLIDFKRIAQAKEIEVIDSEVIAIDSTQNEMTLADNRKIKFDVAVLNVGGRVRKIPSLRNDNIFYLRPFQKFLIDWEQFVRKIESEAKSTVVIIGGGAASVETAFSVDQRFKKNKCKPDIHIVTASRRLCENYSPDISNKINCALAKLNIETHFNEKITQIYEDFIKMSDGKNLKYDYLIQVTPNLPNQFNFLIPNLQFDKNGFPLANDCLQLSSHIFASGDCVSIQNRPDVPKSGVMAVHQGRHILKCINAITNNKNIPTFAPPKRLLNIVTTGKDTAIAVWGSLSLESKLIYKIKRYIDQKYIRLFKNLKI